MNKLINHYFQKIIVLAFIALVMHGCDKDNGIEDKIEQIEVNVVIDRFERDFAAADSETISDLRQNYPFLISPRESDSLMLSKQQDTIQQELFKEVEKEFDSLDEIARDVEQLFQHIKYYDHTFREPRIITLTDDVNYRYKTMVTDSIVLIALDTYLGSEHHFYGNIPKYLTQNMNREHIISDLAANYAIKYIFQTQKKTLLDEMIYFGKQLYFKDKMIPFKPETIRIGYDKDQLNWAMANEYQIWTYFIEKEMLYSTDSSLPNRFIAPAPFSKFYLELDNEAPGRLGQYIGWQIVKSYMENNDIDFLKMMEMEADMIFKNSKYKPNK